MIGVYLKNTVTLMEPTYDTYRNIAGFTETAIKARWIRKDRLVSIPGGREVISSAQIIIKNQTIDNSYKIKYNDVKYAILDIQEMKGFSVHGLEVFLK
jgi:hypothetical protein